jgi:hypothetical protein
MQKTLINIIFINLIIFSSCIILFGCKNNTEEIKIYETRKEINNIGLHLRLYVSKNNIKYKDIEKLSIIDVYEEFDQPIPPTWHQHNDAVDPWGQSYEIKSNPPTIQIISRGSPNNSRKSKSVLIYLDMDFSDIM